MLGRHEAGAVVGADEARLVDFGLASRYVSALTGGHRAATPGGSLGGTPRFVGLAAHAEGAPPCRRDDVEALGHMLLCVAGGDALPWDGAASDDGVLRLKRAAGAPAAVVAALDLAPFGDAAPLAAFLEDCRALGHADAPDYAKLRAHLERLAAGAKAREPAPKARAPRRAAPMDVDDPPPKRRATPRRRAAPMDVDDPPPAAPKPAAAPKARAKPKSPAPRAAARKAAAPKAAPKAAAPKAAPKAAAKADVSLEALLAKARRAKK